MEAEQQIGCGVIISLAVGNEGAGEVLEGRIDR
jgi:hypothetical protein